LPGKVQANQQATLYSKVPGYLKSLSVDKGDTVKAGQSLGEIEAPELAAERVKYKAERTVAETELKRLSEARSKAPDLVTPQSVDEAQGRFDIAGANIERIDTLLNYSRLTAPFDGIVTARFVDPGAFIPSATSRSAAGNAAVITIMDFNTVRVQVPVPEAEAAMVKAGQPVKFIVDVLKGREFSASVSRLSYAIDAATQTMLVEADVKNDGYTLRPGMFVTARIGVEMHADALLVPAEAVLLEKTGTSVFTVAGGKARKLAVKTGFTDGASVEILDGLSPNQEVALLGKATLNNDQPVHAAEAK
jgi:RND family efflux transporter MFP subunit